jgi:rare lipoprotein A
MPFNRYLLVIIALFLFFCTSCAQRVALTKKTGTKSYTVLGQTYTPLKRARIGYSETGVASWYGPGFHGKKTSSGEIYDMHCLTAAHKTLPLNSTVKVTNLKTCREVTVRVNDRGPFVDDRVIDLSLAAAKEIDLVSDGTAPVRVTVVGEPGTLLAKRTPKSGKQKTLTHAPNPYYRPKKPVRTAGKDRKEKRTRLAQLR